MSAAALAPLGRPLCIHQPELVAGQKLVREVVCRIAREKDLGVREVSVERLRHTASNRRLFGRFDLYGGEFTHRGEDCTFETMINQLGLSGNAGLRQVAEIVHDMDLKDDKFNRSEAAGLNLVIRGLAELLKDDRKLVAQSIPIFDGLYELLGRNQETAKGAENDKKRTKNRAAKRSRRGARK